MLSIYHANCRVKVIWYTYSSRNILINHKRYKQLNNAAQRGQRIKYIHWYIENFFFLRYYLFTSLYKTSRPIHRRLPYQ